MSIATPFNPMGTLWAELPYVQPIMVSASDWSNKTGEGACTFGMTTQNLGGNWGDRALWRAFHDNAKIPGGRDAPEYYWGINMNASEAKSTITFIDGHKVKIKGFDFITSRSGWSPGDFTLTLYGNNNSDEEWNYIGQVTNTIFPFPTGWTKLTFKAETPGFYNSYLFKVTDIVRFPMLLNIHLDATYKP